MGVIHASALLEEKKPEDAVNSLTMKGQSRGSQAVSPTGALKSCLSCHTGDGKFGCTLAIKLVRISLRRSIVIYAFLDPGNGVSFCTEKLMNDPWPTGQRLKIKLQITETPCEIETYGADGLELSDLTGEGSISLSYVYSPDRCQFRKNIFLCKPIWHSCLTCVTFSRNHSRCRAVDREEHPRCIYIQGCLDRSKGKSSCHQRVSWVDCMELFCVVCQMTVATFLSTVLRCLQIEEIQEMKVLDKLYTRVINLKFTEHGLNAKKELFP